MSGQRSSKGGSFIGPSRLLAIEEHRSTDGTRKQGSTAWCVRGRRLLKCCLEQLRPATERETILAELERDAHEDWDFQKVARDLGGNEFLDVSAEVPTAQEWEHDQDPTHVSQPLTRCNRERAAKEEELGVDPHPSDLVEVGQVTDRDRPSGGRTPRMMWELNKPLVDRVLRWKKVALLTALGLGSIGGKEPI